MIAIWALLSIGAQIATRYVIAQNSFILGSQATLLPYILLEIVLVAAFWRLHERRPPPEHLFPQTRPRVTLRASGWSIFSDQIENHLQKALTAFG